jgi:hypothetical protein
MKKTLAALVALLALSGCVAYPAYPAYPTYPYTYAEPYAYGYAGPSIAISGVFIGGGHRWR